MTMFTITKRDSHYKLNVILLAKNKNNMTQKIARYVENVIFSK